MTFEEALNFNIEQLTGGFVALRDSIKKKEAELVEALKPSKEQLEVLRAALQKKLQDMGVNSAKTSAGTPYLSTKTSVKVVNWEEFYAFVQEVQDDELLTHGANKTKVEEYAESMGRLPPGLETSQYQDLNVRSS